MSSPLALLFSVLFFSVGKLRRTGLDALLVQRSAVSTPGETSTKRTYRTADVGTRSNDLLRSDAIILTTIASYPKPVRKG